MTAPTRLLHDLEGRPPADHEHPGTDGNAIVQQRVPEHFVHGVVPPDVFAGHEHVAGQRRQTGSVQPSRALEHALGGAKPLGQCVERVDVEDAFHAEGGAAHLERVDAGFPAHPTGAGRVAVPVERVRFGHERRPQGCGDDVVLLLRGDVQVRAIVHPHQVVRGADHPFGQQVTRHQLEVVTGRPHRDGHGAPGCTRAQADLQGFLGGDVVAADHVAAAIRAVLDHPHPGAHGRAGSRVSHPSSSARAVTP
jgi:hypothetical protein